MVRMAIVLLLFAPRLFACQCMGPLTPQQKIDNATLIFTGRVATIENPQQARLDAMTDTVARKVAWQAGVDKSLEEGWGPHHGRRVPFEEVTVYAGSPTETVELWTGQGGGDCAIDVYEGLFYVVFAHVNKADRFICSTIQK